jgi:hypothetical protein
LISQNLITTNKKPHECGDIIDWKKIPTHIYVLRCSLISIDIQKKKPPRMEAFSS